MITTIKKIADTLNKTINSLRPPQAAIPAILIVCSAINRPGLSAIELAARIISKQKKHGLAFGPLPDGAQNGYETIIKVIAEELVDMYKQQSSVQAAGPIGGISISAWGSNAGGSFIANGFNILPFKVFGFGG